MPPRVAPIGRTSELAAVRKALETVGRCTVTGPGGVGKTTVAAAVAGASDPATTVWVEAAAIERCDTLYEALAGALGVVMTASEPAARVCRETFEQWSGLVVLDSVEHLAEDLGPEVGKWAVSSGGPRMIVTSRRPLAANVLPIVRLAPLPLAAGPPETGPAAHLLFQNVQARGGNPQSLRSDTALLAALLESTGGLPLAIELTAERIIRLGAGVAAEATASSLGDALNDCVGRSLALLPPEDGLLFRRLGLTVGELSAEALTLFTDPPPDTALTSTARLVDIGLVRAHGSSFGILPPLRDSAAQLLGAAGEYDDALAGIVARALRLLPDWPSRGRSATPPPLDLLVHIARLALKVPDLRTDAVQLVEQLQEPLYRRMRLREALQLLTAVFDQCGIEQTDPVRSARLAARAARVASEADTIPRAEQWLDRARRAAARVDDASMHGRLWSLHAVFCLDAGRLTEAASALDRALALSTRAGDEPAVHHIGHLTAECALAEGNLGRAERIARNALSECQRDNPTEALVLRTTLGWCLIERGRLDEASAHARQLRQDIANQMGEDTEIGVDADLIAIAADPTVVPLSPPLGDDAPWWMRLHQRLRHAARLPITQHWPEVLHTAADVVVLADLVPIASARIAANTLLGDAALAANDLGQAGAAYLAALRDASRGPFRLRAADALDGLATLLATLDRPETAHVVAAVAQSIRDSCGAQPWPRPSLPHQVVATAVPDGWLTDAVPTVHAMDTIEQHIRRRPSRHPWDPLTRTEKVIADLVVKGNSNQEIAQQLFISRRTVESHLAHTFTKLGIKSRTQLAARTRAT